MPQEAKFDPIAFVEALKQGQKICDIKVCGVCIGDRFKDLTEVSLTEQELRSGSWMRMQSRIRFYGVEEEGVKRIEGIYIAALHLKPLAVPLLETIQHYCGPAYFVEQRMGQTYYHYPKHKTILSPVSNNENLVGVHIGNAGPRLPIYTAYSLLDTFVEFLLPLDNYQREIEIETNPGSLQYYYQQRLTSLLRAFGVGEELNSDLGSCKFILARNPDEEKEVEAFLLDLIKNMKDREFAQRLNSMRGRHQQASSQFDIYLFFTSLLTFYVRYKRFVANNSISLEGPSFSLEFASYYTRQVYTSIQQEAVEKIRTILAFILDPAQRSFDKKQMIEQFGYPDVDLEQMKSQEDYY
ncbi:MAG: hypothetical protein KTR30_25550 [Saprospiraceae bacterium]|nr:hypothetical protein [Saprospiraceae bacterium]